MSIQVKNISKQFKDFTALNDVSLDIHSGELIALLGPSGSGKTTLLRIIAGLEFADSGTILFNGQNTSKKSLKERGVGFVFQHYALFKHMTVFDNIAFGLRVRPRITRPSNQMIEHKVMSLLKLVHLDKLHDRYPSQLSGGQRQRVALARSLAVEPKVLLLDEPFGALDSKVRKELRRWMRRLHDELNVTSIFVTHDQEEAMEVADRVVVMSHGRIEQAGTPSQVYNEPVNSFVYDFLGNYNEFAGWKGDDGTAHITEYETTNDLIANKDTSKHKWLTGKPIISNVLQNLMPRYFHDNSSEPIMMPSKTTKIINGPGKVITIFARPHDMDVTKTPVDNDYIKTRVIHINPAGSLIKLELERENGSVIQAEIPKELFSTLQLQRNDVVYTRPKETRVFE